MKQQILFLKLLPVLSFIYLLIVLGSIYILYSSISFMQLLTLSILVAQLVGNWYLVITNPSQDSGLFPVHDELPVHRSGTCPSCGIPQHESSHHCPLCEFCVLRHDHHCFFLGVCIGLKNHCYFLVFCFYVALGASFLCLIIIESLSLFLGTPLDLLDYLFPASLSRYILWGSSFQRVYLVFVLNTLFPLLVFSFGMLCFQSYLISAGITSYEHHKRRKRRKHSSFRLIFGKRGFLHFLVPIPVIQRSLFFESESIKVC